MTEPSTSIEPSSAILTVPNILTFLRIALTPLFIYYGVFARNVGAALVVTVIAFATDLIDGKVARHFGQVSKLGIVLDPLSDRLGLAAGVWMLIATHLAPVWAVVIVAARDGALVLVGAPLLKARGIPIPPVTWLGKRASFAVSFSLMLFIAAGVSSVAHPNRGVQIAAWTFYVIGVPLYYFTALTYVRAGLRSMSVKSEQGAG